MLRRLVSGTASHLEVTQAALTNAQNGSHTGGLPSVGAKPAVA